MFFDKAVACDRCEKITRLSRAWRCDDGTHLCDRCKHEIEEGSEEEVI